MKVSLPGKTIQSTDPRDYVFNSKFGSVKVVQEPPGKITAQVTIAPTTSLDLVIAHNLGFIPLCLVFVENTPGSGRYYCGASFVAPEDFPQNITLNAIYNTPSTYADINNLHLGIQNSSAFPKTVKYYYFIFGDAGT